MCPYQIESVFYTDQATSDAIRAIDILVPKIVSTKGNNDTFVLRNNGSILESTVVKLTNLSNPNMTFPVINGSDGAIREHVIVPTHLLQNSTDTPIRVSAPVSAYKFPITH